MIVKIGLRHNVSTTQGSPGPVRYSNTVTKPFIEFTASLLIFNSFKHLNSHVHVHVDMATVFLRMPGETMKNCRLHCFLCFSNAILDNAIICHVSFLPMCTGLTSLREGLVLVLKKEVGSLQEEVEHGKEQVSD